jgi:eukaryotic-like serine/threonine-protein kinase
VARLIARCLEKNPFERFQAARDLAFDLRAALDDAPAPAPPPPSPRRRARWPIVAAAAAALTAGGVEIGRGFPPAPVEDRVDYKRLTFRRGTVDNARFAPDGSTVIYSAAFGGEPPRVYATVPGARESRTLTAPGYRLAAVGRDGELAVLRGQTLARTSLSGAAPRDIADGVLEADFTPTGELAVVRRGVIELPLGHPVYRTHEDVKSLHVAPDGGRVAFVEHPVSGDEAGRVCTVSLAGAYACSTDAHWYVMNRVVWGGGDQLWFSAIDEGSRGGVYTVAAPSAPRRVLALQQSAFIFDVGPSGALVRLDDATVGAYYRDAAGVERYLSWFDVSLVTALAPDGSELLFAEGGMGGTNDYEAYLRPTDGGPAVHIGAGWPGALSDDKQWVILFQRSGDQHRVVVMPTGAGVAHELPRGPVTRYLQGNASFFPGAARIVFTARAAGEYQVFAQDVAGGDPVALTGEGWLLGPIATLTPDARAVLLFDLQGRYVLHPLDGGADRPLPQITGGDLPFRFSPDGHALFISAAVEPRHVRVTRLDLDTGVQTPVSDVRTDHDVQRGPYIAADGRSLAFSEWRVNHSLFAVSGLRP